MRGLEAELSDETKTTGGEPGVDERLSENALKRRVKRWWREAPYEAYMQATPGLEQVTAAELAELGFISEGRSLNVEPGGVTLPLEPAEVMRANLSLSTASRVLLRLGTFPASSVEMLYDRARKLPWEVHLGFQTEFELHVTARASKLQAGEEVAKTVASGVSRHMRPLGLYPKRAESAPLKFHVRLLNDYCTISLNSSGEHLHRRGVRRHVHHAPVRETLAAAMVRLGLEDQQPFDAIVDPFVGSGTLLLEAAGALVGSQPGRHRTFAFQDAAWFLPGRWREVQREAERRAQAAPAPLPKLLGFDNDRGALQAARLNLKEVTASGQPEVNLAEADSTRLDFTALGVERGLILTNLPYGVRSGTPKQAIESTRRFLSQLVLSGKSWRVVLLSSQREADVAASLLDVKEQIHTRNGGLKVVLTVAEVSGS